MSTALVKSKSNKSLAASLSNRKSLVDLVSETKLRDPAAFAKQRITALDNNARQTNEKKRQLMKEIERDEEELRQLDKQISLLESRYNQLLSSLNGR